MDWLPSILTGEPGKPVKEIYRLGAEKGFSVSTIDRAKKMLESNIQSRRVGYGEGGYSVWELTAKGFCDYFGTRHHISQIKQDDTEILHTNEDGKPSDV